MDDVKHKQDEAIRLAEIWDNYLPASHYGQIAHDTASELRTLYHERNLYRESATYNGRLFALCYKRVEADEQLLMLALESLAGLVLNPESNPLLDELRQRLHPSRTISASVISV